jgi:hypothetical protein
MLDLIEEPLDQISGSLKIRGQSAARLVEQPSAKIPLREPEFAAKAPIGCHSSVPQRLRNLLLGDADEVTEKVKIHSPLYLKNPWTKLHWTNRSASGTL